MIADDNARRRNLVVTSLIIIFFNVSGASFTNGNGVTLGFISVHIAHEWVIYAFAWAMFAWFWWQFAITAPSFREDLKNELTAYKFGHEGEDRYSRDNLLYRAMEKEAIKKIKEQNRWAEFGHNSNSITEMNVQSPRFYLLEPWSLVIWRSGNMVFNLRLSWLDKFRILRGYILGRPGFSEIALPQLLAASAVLISVLFFTAELLMKYVF